MPEGDHRATKRSSWSFIALLGCVSGLSAFGMASVVPALPSLATTLSVDFSAVQFVVSAYLLGLGLFQPIQGLLCDRFGRRPVLLGGFLVFAIGSLAASLSSGLVTLVLARFLQAMGVSVATVVTRAIVRDTHEPEQAAVALSFISAFMGLAPIIAPIAGGFVTALWSWRAVFVLHSVLAGILLIWLVLSLRETRPASTRAMPFSSLLAGFRILMRDRVFVSFSMIYAFISAGSFAFITVGAALFGRLFGMTAASFGTLWAGLALAYLCGAALAGALASRFGSQRMIRAGLALNLMAATAFVLAAFWPTPRLDLFMTALIGQMGANGLISPLALSGSVSERPDLAGVASGLSSAVAMLVSMLSAALTGVIYDATAVPVAILIASCAMLAAFVSRRAVRSSLTAS